MKYTVIMYGTTGEYRTEYKSKVKAERAAANIRGLGYEAKVVKNEKAAANTHTSDGKPVTA